MCAFTQSYCIVKWPVLSAPAISKKRSCSHKAAFGQLRFSLFYFQTLFDGSTSLLFPVLSSPVHSTELCSRWFSCAAVCSFSTGRAASRNLRSKEFGHDTESNAKLPTNTALSASDSAKQGWKASCSFLGTSTSAKSFLGLSDRWGFQMLSEAARQCSHAKNTVEDNCCFWGKSFPPQFCLWFLCCTYILLYGKYGTSSFTQAHISLVWFLFAGECFCSYLHFCEGVSHPHHFAYCNSLHILLPLIENNWEFRVEKIAPIKSGDPWTSSLAFFTHILWFSSLEAALQGKNQIVSPFLCSGKAKLFLKPSQQWLIAISLEQMWASSQFMLNALISSSKRFVKSKNAFFSDNRKQWCNNYCDGKLQFWGLCAFSFKKQLQWFKMLSFPTLLFVQPHSSFPSLLQVLLKCLQANTIHNLKAWHQLLLTAI